MDDLPAEPKSWRLAWWVLFVALAIGTLAWVLIQRGGGERTYSLAATRACLQARGREVRFYPNGYSFSTLPTLVVGPFGQFGNDPDEPTDILEFAPTPRAADDAKYRDSDATARKGNVLSPSAFTDPVVEECLADGQASQ